MAYYTKLKFILQYNANDTFSYILLPHSVLSTALHLSFTSLIISLILHSCCCFHTNALLAPPAPASHTHTALHNLAIQLKLNNQSYADSNIIFPHILIQHIPGNT